MTLAAHRTGARIAWRLLAYHPAAAPLLPPPPLAEARSLARLAAAQPGALPPDLQQLAQVAHLAGTTRRLRPAPGAGLGMLQVLAGALDGPGGPRAICRVTIAGRPSEAFALAHGLAGALRLSAPLASLADEALAADAAPPPRHLGAPVLPEAASVDQALALVLDQLGAVLLHWAARARPDAGEEPVHQMRVAVRRLRSALRLFGRTAACPALAAAEDGLRGLGRSLGAARDWDVFLGGLGRTVAAEFADERAIARLLGAAERQRRTRYAELLAELDGPAFRRLGLTLAELSATRPWRSWTAPEETPGLRAAALDCALGEFGRHALQRRLRRVSRAGRGFAARSPEELHALRLHCKRLRYACELFSPAFPGRAAQRFAHRLATVQDRLGALNDGAVAAGLMRQLGAGGGLAGGLVRGFVAARDAEARARAERSWRRFRHCAPFWG